MEFDRDLASIQRMRDTVAKAVRAQETLGALSQDQTDRICQAISEAGIRHAEALAALAVEETGFGNTPDKTQKNTFAARHVWEAIRDIKTRGILARDEKKKTIDIGVPVGVVAAIVPSTNPTSTVIYKALICLKAGNPVVFSPHPKATKCTCRAVALLMQAAKAAGCPDGALGCIESTMDATQALLKHPDVRMILATGGSAMVRAAYSSGKPAIGVGPGNGPAYIHRSANFDRAAESIIRSKTFDNGTICAAEQSVIVESCCADKLRQALRNHGAYLMNSEEAGKLADLLLRPNGSINPAVVGKSAVKLAQMAGFTVPAHTTALVAKAHEAGPTRPYSREKLCPVLACFEADSEDAVLEKVCEVLAVEGSGHTFSIHAQDQAVIEKFALRVPVSRFLVNTPAALGGIGATTNLFPALTLGCGALGGSSSSNNIGPVDLINIRRVAWGVRDMPAGVGQTKAAVVQDDALIEQLTAQIMEKLAKM